MKRFLFAVLLMSFAARPATAVEQQTSHLRISGNLDAGSSLALVPAAGSSFAAYAAAAQFSATAEVRDSLLAAHTISMFFYHTSVGNWTVVAVVPGDDVGEPLPTELGRAQLTFGADGNRHVIPVFPASDITVVPAWSNGSSATSSLSFTFDPLTSYARVSAIGTITDDSQRGCGGLATCIGQNLPPVLAACSAGSVACASPLSDSFLVPGDITERAIAAAGCEGRVFSSKRWCRDCYHRAWRKIRAAASSNLFGKFLAQASAQVYARRDQSCGQ